MSQKFFKRTTLIGVLHRRIRKWCELFLLMRLPKQLDQIFQLANEFDDDESAPVSMTVDECWIHSGDVAGVHELLLSTVSNLFHLCKDIQFFFIQETDLPAISDFCFYLCNSQSVHGNWDIRELDFLADCLCCYHLYGVVPEELEPLAIQIVCIFHRCYL